MISLLTTLRFFYEIILIITRKYHLKIVFEFFVLPENIFVRDFFFKLPPKKIFILFFREKKDNTFYSYSFFSFTEGYFSEDIL